MMLRKKTILRLLVFCLSVLAAAGWFFFAPWLPAVSPLVAIASSLAVQRVAFYTLLGLPLLILAVITGRWFCWNMCPAGFVFDMAGRLNCRGNSWFKKIPRVAPWILLIGLGCAAVGAPLVLWMDPLVAFNGFFSVFGSLSVASASLIPAFVFLLVLILSFCVPNLWCQRLCPLGAGLGLVRAVWFKKTGRNPEEMEDVVVQKDSFVVPKLARRGFLFLLGGVGLGSALRFFKTSSYEQAIRPPGAVDEGMFSFLCARCGNCFRQCPEKIIVPDVGKTGLAGLFSPILDFSAKYCDESCNECGKVCASGAIRPFLPDEKRMGTAFVNKALCFAWGHGSHCMLCQVYCPYEAIEEVEQGGVHCPVIDASKCRGCGACQSRCPVEPVRAITVRGFSSRKKS